MKTRVSVLTEFNRPLVTEEREIPPLREGEILVRITASGVCGSDVHMWKGTDPRTPLPLVPGHEGVGTVEEIAGNRTDIHGTPLKPGDYVIWDRGYTCGRCYFCTVRKEPFLCPHRRVYGIVRDGCYATHLVLTAATNVVRVDSDIDPSVLVPVSCSGATTAHTMELCPVHTGDTVVIQGPGPMGMFALAFAAQAGAANLLVLGTGADGKRLELAPEFGATHTLVIDDSPPERQVEYVRDITHGRGADAVIDCTGSPRAVNAGLSMTAPGGTYTLPGIAVPAGEIPIRFYEDVARKNVRIQGVWVSDTRHLYRALNLVLSRKFPFEKLVTHRFPLEKATEALKTVEGRSAMKAVLLPRGDTDD